MYVLTNTLPNVLEFVLLTLLCRSLRIRLSLEKLRE